MNDVALTRSTSELKVSPQEGSSNMTCKIDRLRPLVVLVGATLLYGGIAICGLRPAAADQLAWSLDSANTSFSGTTSGLVLGNQFSVSSESITIDAVGYYEDAGTSLFSPHDIGFYNDTTGNLIAGSTATLSSGTNAGDVGGFVFEDLSTPLKLGPGLYTEVATDPYSSIAPNDDYLNESSTASNITGVKFIEAYYYYTSSPSLSIDPFYNYLGTTTYNPDFFVSAVGPAPESSTAIALGSMLATGITWMALSRKRTKSSS